MQTCLAGLLSTCLLDFCDYALCSHPTSWGTGVGWGIAFPHSSPALVE